MPQAQRGIPQARESIGLPCQSPSVGAPSEPALRGLVSRIPPGLVLGSV